uniref:Uncharacterized protein n=1 Tax=Avena sativa TaxID=4498 RepID=A0ACD5YCQ9_AVESA
MNGEMMMTMRPPVPAPYQVWAAALAQQQQQLAPAAGVFKPARPAWKRVARQPGRKHQHQQQRKGSSAGARSAAPRNTTSYLIRSKQAGGVGASPCPVTPAVLSPAREVLVEMAKEAWGVDGYGSMKGLIRLRPQAAPDAEGDGEGSGSGESDVEEHVEVERRLDHDLSRFEMVQLPAPAADEDEEGEARAARLEEENLTLRARLFLVERDMADIRRRLQAVESLCRDRHRDGCVVDVPSETVSGAGSADAMTL